MNNEQTSQEYRPQEETPAVRHIPIFVEGRDEPVFNKKLSNSDLNPRKTSDGKVKDDDSNAIRKPSDFYPSGLKKVSRGATHPPNLDVNQRYTQEPTSPLSPPTGPIPMGYDPNVNFEPTKQEPTSPQPPPPGPIPMTCSPNLFPYSIKEDNPLQENSSPQQNISKDYTDATNPEIGSNIGSEEGGGYSSRKTSTEPPGSQEGVHIVRINIQSEEELDNTKGAASETKEEEKQVDPAIAKLQKVKDEVSGLVEKIESYKGSKTDKEYKYLDEMLTRHLCTLDSIESGGRDDIRQMRKDTIRSINRCVSMLDARAKENVNNRDADDNNAILEQLAAKSNTEY
jgi:hypothetical protein